MMDGMMDGGMTGQPQPGLVGQQPQQIPEAQAEPDAQEITPSKASQKEDYDQWLARATELLHSPDTRDEVVGSLQHGKTHPVETVADLTVMIVTRLDQAARQAGIEVEDVVKMLGAHEVIKQLVEIAEAAKAFTLSEQYQELSLSLAVQEYCKQEIAGGRIDPKKLQATMAESVQQMPPGKRAELDQSTKRIAATAQEYERSKAKGVTNGPNR